MITSLEPTDLIRCFDAFSDLDAGQSLAVHLYDIVMNMPDNQHHEYVKNLVSRISDFQTHPIMWSDEDRSRLLSGTIALSVFDRLILPKFKAGSIFGESKFPGFDIHIFRLCYAIMLSRAFEVSEDQIAIAPFADQLNHSQTLQCTIPRTAPDGSVRLIAERPISKGEEVYNFYGNHPNTLMFLTHGFIGDNRLILFLEDWLTGSVNDKVGGMVIDPNSHAGLSDELMEFLMKTWSVGMLEAIKTLLGVLSLKVTTMEDSISRLESDWDSDRQMLEIAKAVTNDELQLLSSWLANIREMISIRTVS